MKTAILFIHGIIGSPAFFNPFLPLVPSDWTVHNMLLKGHGGSVKALSATSMSEWKQQVHDALQALLAANDKVVVAAYSMGTLLAIQEAVQAPLTALFLLNVPLKLHIRPRLFRTVWKVFRGNIKPGDEWMLAAQQVYGLERDPHILRYLGWIPRYLELFVEIEETRKIAHNLTSMCHVYLALQDEAVSLKTRELFDGNPFVTVKTLSTSGHFYYSPQAWQLLRNDFRDMIQKVSQIETQCAASVSAAAERTRIFSSEQVVLQVGK